MSKGHAHLHVGVVDQVGDVVRQALHAVGSGGGVRAGEEEEQGRLQAGTG